MDATQWFREQLQASAEGFVWGVRQIPYGRLHTQPPRGLGEWTAARHVFHMLFYEQTIALPSMWQWLGEPCPALDDADEDRAWDNLQSVSLEDLLSQFSDVRTREIALLDRFDGTLWNASRDAVWGPVTLFWVVSKTYQHTAEHTNDVLRIALFWDRFAARQKEREAG